MSAADDTKLECNEVLNDITSFSLQNSFKRFREQKIRERKLLLSMQQDRCEVLLLSDIRLLIWMLRNNFVVELGVQQDPKNLKMLYERSFSALQRSISEYHMQEGFRLNLILVKPNWKFLDRNIPTLSSTLRAVAPLYLDCCGLVRQVLLDLQQDFGFIIGNFIIHL